MTPAARRTESDKRLLQKHEALGKCAVCDHAWVQGIADLEGAGKGSDPLCISETGRLAYLCDDHRIWTWRIVK
jgi:hypothetical protein